MDAEILRRAAVYPKVAPEQALALILDHSLGRRAYEGIRQLLLNIGLDVFPAYNHVREAKNRCLPEEITITETEGSVTVPALLEHTTARLL